MQCSSEPVATFFVHCLRQHRISRLEGIDAVNQITVEFAHVHHVPANTIDQRRVGSGLALTIPITVLLCAEHTEDSFESLDDNEVSGRCRRLPKSSGLVRLGYGCKATSDGPDRTS